MKPLPVSVKYEPIGRTLSHGVRASAVSEATSWDTLGSSVGSWVYRRSTGLAVVSAGEDCSSETVGRGSFATSVYDRPSVLALRPNTVLVARSNRQSSAPASRTLTVVGE